jgi:uncharacterized protein involved in exopolysaccharide biosynthesis
MGDLGEIVSFPLRAVRRHRVAFALLFGAMALMVVLAAILLPKHYLVETKFFAQRNVVMPALGNPRRAVPSESDAPTRLASEAVLKRENLIEVIRETNLMANWSQIRSPLGKARDAVTQWIRGPMSDSDRVNAMVGLLEARMWVASADGTVRIGVDWVDPSAAYRIVQAAQQNFFDERHASEISMIGESIGILETHVTGAETAIQEALAHIRPAGGARSLAFAPRRVRPAAAANPAAAGLQAELSAKVQTIGDLQSARNLRLATLQNHLAELRNVYGPAHPEISATQQSIKTLSSDSPQLTTLRAEAQDLRSRLTALGVTPGETAPASQFEPALDRATLDRLVRQRPDSQEDPQTTYAKSRLKIATSDYEDLLDRLEGAHIELETARAAFKYRYNIITPAQVPSKPSKPKMPLLFAGGFLLAVVMAVFAVTTIDIARGRILEPWQVRRQLGLPVLADVHHGS